MGNRQHDNKYSTMIMIHFPFPRTAAPKLCSHAFRRTTPPTARASRQWFFFGVFVLVVSSPLPALLVLACSASYGAEKVVQKTSASYGAEKVVQIYYSFLVKNIFLVLISLGEQIYNLPVNLFNFPVKQEKRCINPPLRAGDRVRVSRVS